MRSGADSERRASRMFKPDPAGNHASDRVRRTQHDRDRPERGVCVPDAGVPLRHLRPQAADLPDVRNRPPPRPAVPVSQKVINWKAIEMSELKQCPKCGPNGAPLRRIGEMDEYRVECVECYTVKTPWFKTPGEAEAYWNAFAEGMKLQTARIAELEKELEQMRTAALGYCELARRLQESLDESERYWDKALVEARKLTENVERKMR